MNNFKSDLQSKIKSFDRLLSTAVPKCDYSESVVCDAVFYSLSNGGKRIRPLLVKEFAALCGADSDCANDAAIAIEMLHTYSLIHDDLPCMDNDDMRRGKPSCHKQFGEEYALLAGDALLTLSFETLSSGKLANNNPALAVRCINVLSSCAGLLGMIGGQVLDIKNEGGQIDTERLILTDKLKTGKLIKAACVMGVICANGSDNDIKAAEEYGENLGLAFQIKDDILDVTSTTEQLGKPIGSDVANNKTTYVTLYGLEGAELKAKLHAQKALNVLEAYGEKAEFLKLLTLHLAARTY